MLNMVLINQAVMLIEDIFEAENIFVTRQSLFNRAVRWYEGSDITDAEVLAAAVFYGEYKPTIDYSKILTLRDMLFPCQYNSKIEDFSIGEIEAAQRDAMWRD